jgi:hypothetical protein
MPQLDPTSYISQLTWLIIIFISFYFMIAQYLVPAISTIFKVRKKKLEASGSGFSSFQDEEKKINQHSEKMLTHSLQVSRTSCLKAMQTSIFWLQEAVKDANQSALLGVNKHYLQSIALIQHQKYLIEGAIKGDILKK